MQIDFAGIDALAERIDAELKKDAHLAYIVRLAAAGVETEWVPFLSEDAARVFEMKHFDGKSYGQIAKAINEESEAVRKTYKRSHNKVSRLFANVDETAAQVEEVKKEAKQRPRSTGAQRQIRDLTHKRKAAHDKPRKAPRLESSELLPFDETEGQAKPQIPPLFLGEIEYVRDFIADLRALGTDSKFEQLTKDLNDVLKRRDSVIVFTQYTDTMDYLRDKLRRGAAVLSRFERSQTHRRPRPPLLPDVDLMIDHHVARDKN